MLNRRRKTERSNLLMRKLRGSAKLKRGRSSKISLFKSKPRLKQRRQLRRPQLSRNRHQQLKLLQQPLRLRISPLRTNCRRRSPELTSKSRKSLQPLPTQKKRKNPPIALTLARKKLRSLPALQAPPQERRPCPRLCSWVALQATP